MLGYNHIETFFLLKEIGREVPSHENISGTRLFNMGFRDCQWVPDHEFRGTDVIYSHIFKKSFITKML
jgi:hypothetical protein